MCKENKEASFIPCGDAAEKMNEIRDEELEQVAGGANMGSNGKCCPKCGGMLMLVASRSGNGVSFAYYNCSGCSARYAENMRPLD